MTKPKPPIGHRTTGVVFRHSSFVIRHLSFPLRTFPRIVVECPSGCLLVLPIPSCGAGLTQSSQSANPMERNSRSQEARMKQLISFSVSVVLGAALVAQADTFPVINANDSGPGSLRAAIDNANDLPGPDVIRFQIPGPGVRTITLLSPLPWVVD